MQLTEYVMLDTLASQPEAVDSQIRLRQLERENAHLSKLVRSLTDAATGPLAARRLVLPIAVSDAPWRQCEFCGCNTNAEERLCCASGRSADRQSWDPA
jgi:hypothetical protein